MKYRSVVQANGEFCMKSISDFLEKKNVKKHVYIQFISPRMEILV